MFCRAATECRPYKTPLEIPVDKQRLTPLVWLGPVGLKALPDSPHVQSFQIWPASANYGENNVDAAEEIMLDYAWPDGFERCRNSPDEPDRQSRKCPSRWSRG